MAGPIDSWYHVSFDDESFHIKIDIPDREEVNVSIKWGDIIRVCFKAGDFLDPDELYIFVSYRPESYVIPTWADGGSDFWGEIIERGLFDADLALKASLSSGGDLFCWPEPEE